MIIKQCHTHQVFIKDYLTNDIMELQMDIKLVNNQIQMVNDLKNGDLSDAISLASDSKDYSTDSLNYKNNDDEILVSNPGKFQFLNT
ncbi:MAG: hypothetical protein ABSE83_02810 [Methanobacterium sp.]